MKTLLLLTAVTMASAAIVDQTPPSKPADRRGDRSLLHL
jgi:hypothetical protein